MTWEDTNIQKTLDGFKNCFKQKQMLSLKHTSAPLSTVPLLHCEVESYVTIAENVSSIVPQVSGVLLLLTKSIITPTHVPRGEFKIGERRPSLANA